MEKFESAPLKAQESQRGKDTFTRALGPIFRKIAGAVIILFLALPPFFTLIYSLFRDFTGIVPRGFTLEFYKDVLVGSEPIFPVLLRTFLMSMIPTMVTMVLLLLCTYGTLVYAPKMDRVLSTVTKIPYGIQGIILAISLIAIYGNSDTILSNRVVLLGLSYCVITSPYMYQGIQNAMATLDPVPILEAAETLGASKFYAFFRLVVPGIRRGLLANGLLCGGLLFGDFVLVNILAGSYYETLAVRLHRLMFFSGNRAAVISVVLFVVMSISSVVVSRLGKTGPERVVVTKEENQ